MPPCSFGLPSNKDLVFFLLTHIFPANSIPNCAQNVQVMRAKAILGLTIDAHEISLVQQAFRSLMRKLHPDRIGDCPKAAEAMELLQESKQQCERLE